MRKLLFIITPIFLILFGFIGVTKNLFIATIYAQSNLRNNEVVTLDKNEVIDNDFFAAGEKVVVSGTVNNDAYIVGGNVIIDGQIKGDLLVAGGNVTISGIVNGNIRAAGGEINISGVIDKNVTIAAGSARLDNSAQVLGNLVAASGNLDIYAPVNGKAHIGAAALTLANRVGGNLVAGVEDLTLTSNASILGDLNYWSENEGDISNDASISGRVNYHKTAPKQVDSKGMSEFLTALRTGFNIFNFLAATVLGSILILLFPNFMQRSADIISKKPWVTLFAGLVTLFITPFVIVLMLITLVGIPLGLFAIAAYFFIIYLSQIFVANFIGQKVLNYANQKFHPVFGLLVGLLLLGVLGLIPIVGGILQFFVVLFGIGAYVLTKKEIFSDLRAKKVV